MISAIVPTRRGAERLARYLPSVVESLARCGDAHELVVVDDGGRALGDLPAGTQVVVLPASRGYGEAVNEGVRAARGDRLLILNDDVELFPDTVRVLLAHLTAPIFAVVPGIHSPLAACGDEGGKAGDFEAGVVELRETTASGAHPTLYAVGCCVVCERAGFLALGGYDATFAPFFWEDVDLGYRAWRRGMAILHVPEASCRHDGSATLREQYTLEERERVFFRHRVLFHLRNLQDPALRAQNLGAWAAFALFDDRIERRAGLVEALDRFERVGRHPDEGLRDAEILARACEGARHGADPRA
jgi:GT2 family glycosyltransferase